MRALRLPALLALLLAACATAHPAVPGPLPETPEQAQAQKAQGARWDDAAVRAAYLQKVSAIAADDAALKARGATAEARARHAYQVRHDARLTCRAMMADPAEVQALQARDQEKYGHPDGPTFEQLVEHEHARGRPGDAAYEAIIESSQRTNAGVNARFGL